jgi:nicotinamide mononucleotide adenylyltransferase
MSLAELGMRFYTQGAEKTARQLDDIADKWVRVQKASDSLTTSHKLLDQALSGHGQTVNMVRPAIVALAGSLGASLAIVGPLVLATGALTLAWLDGERTALGYQRAVTGVGRAVGLTAGELRDLTVAAADAGDVSIRSAQQMASSFLATGRASRESLSQAIAMQKDFASFMGVEGPAATKALASAMEDPIRAGKAWTEQFGLLSQEQLKEMEAAQKAGDANKAIGILFGQLKPAIQGHAEHVGVITNAWDAATIAISNWITKAGEAMYVTQDERIEKIQGALANRPLLLPSARRGLENQLFTETYLRDMEKRRQADFTAQAAANQRAQLIASERDKPKKPTGLSAAERREASLAREMEAIQATTRANLDLAAAYGVSDAAALRAAAAADATGRAIKRQGDIDAFVAAQLQLNASKTAADAAKTIADLRISTEVRERMNAAISSGLMTADQVNEQLQLEAELRPMIAAAAVAEGQAKRDLEGYIRALTDARRADNAAAREAQIIEANRKDREQLGQMGAEMGLVGASDMERAIAMARMQRMQELGGDAGSAAGQAAFKLAEDMAAAQVRLEQRQRAYNLGLEYQLDLLRQIDDTARAAADGMTSAFGTAGKAFGDVATAMSGYQVRIEGINRAEDDYRKSVGEFIDPRRIEMFAKEREQAEVQSYGNMLSAAKGYFKEGSDGYRVMHAAEQAYRAFQFAMSIQAIALNATETGSAVAQSGIRAASFLAEGAAKMFAALGPFGFPAVAAMIAVLASLGLKGKGGSGGGYSAANDNVDASVATTQGYVAADERARDSAAQSVASKVEVRVTADREGLNAYVARTAQREAVGVAAPMVAAAAAGTKRDVFQTLSERQVGNRKVSV